MIKEKDIIAEDLNPTFLFTWAEQGFATKRITTATITLRWPLSCQAGADTGSTIKSTR